MKAGRTLGHYRLVECLGRGGMGEVWKARDDRLDRDVAVKVLSSAVSDDEEARGRFEREAKAAAALSHPNICVVYDVGRDGGVDFIVMELVRGTTLGDRLRAGPLPLPEAIRSTIELSHALHEAHRVGIVHRDLKPANVMITSRGVKLLDFGVAKRVPAGTERPGETMMAAAATRPGTVLGTLPYMAPEQLRGAVTDTRTDVFALGGVLFEMVTGRRPFDADTDAGVIAAVLAGPTPSILQHRAEAPPFLDRVIARCLEKRAEDRWPSALDLAKELEWIADKPDSAPPTPARRAAPAVSRLAIEYFRSADGAVIAAARGGTGPPLFVVPSMAGTIEAYWEAFAAAFPSHQIITFDRRGSGVSARGFPSEDAETYLRDTEAVVDGFALSSFDVLGTLLGTVEAAWLAARYRDRVGRLVLRAPVMGLADWAQIPVVRAVLAALEHDWEFFIEAFSQLVVGWGNPKGRALASLFRQSTTRDELRALLYAYTRLDLMPLFTAIRAPTLVEHNPAHFFPPTYSRSIASIIPNCRMVIYHGPKDQFVTDFSMAREFFSAGR
jgi:pimeloyl-ACP methyl ester carboxylesterase/predicted Ser/Thr protein kinase